jgi:hypothetical protein
VINDQFHSYWHCLTEENQKSWETPPVGVADQSHNTKKAHHAGHDKTDTADPLEERIREYNAELDRFKKLECNLELSYQIFFKKIMQESIMYAHTLFQSPDFFSEHIENIEELKHLLNTIVVKARLPDKESLEGLCVLRSAWDVFDIGQSNLHSYKLLSKVIYLFVLASGIATVCLTVFADPIDTALADLDTDMTPTGSIIFYLSVVSTFVTALSAYLNPSGRWRQIRDATCHLESAIWQYRTRTGPYKIRAHGEDKTAALLKNEVVHAVETLIGASDIGQSTSWTKVYPHSVYKHGQRTPPATKEGLFSACLSALTRRAKWGKVAPEATVSMSAMEARAAKVPDVPCKAAAEPQRDDHYSPLTPEQYIAFRLRKAAGFYKRRLPVYTRARNVLSVTVLLVSGAGTVLAYRQLSNYVSISASVAAAITSWMEYSNTATKIGRYNGTASGIESLILWWSSLPEVEKSIVTRIDALVCRGEQVPPLLHGRRGRIGSRILFSCLPRCSKLI